MIAECQKELGYEDGTLLHNVRRYKAYCTNEIATLTRGGERLVRYAQKLQERLPPDQVYNWAIEAMQK